MIARHPTLVVNNVRLYHSHAYLALVTSHPDGWQASLSIQFYNKEGEMYHVAQVWRYATPFRWWARMRADLRFNAIMVHEREGIQLPEVLKERQRCFNTSEGIAR